MIGNKNSSMASGGNKLKRLEQLGLPGRDGFMLGFEARGLKKLRLEKSNEVFLDRQELLQQNTHIYVQRKIIWKDINKTYLYLLVFLH